MPEPLLEITDLVVAAEESEILHGLSLSVAEGEVHALMGPNGAGKSTLANVLLGRPDYRVRSGSITFRGQDILPLSPDARARLGLFLAFQYPESINGVSVLQFLRQAVGARRGIEDLSVLEVRLELSEWLGRLKMDSAFAERYLNEGFSGGERKRNEILQMALLRPDLAILDETDSGLDIDALGVVASGVATVRAARPQMGVLVVTHYATLLNALAPDVVHVLIDGRLVASGGADVAQRIDRDGYGAFRPVLR